MLRSGKQGEARAERKGRTGREHCQTCRALTQRAVRRREAVMRREVLSPPAGFDTSWREQRDREIEEDRVYHKIRMERIWAERRRLGGKSVYQREMEIHDE